jgi:hypothetical protein
MASLPIVDAYLDESSDEKREQAFCVGGIIAGAHHWRPIQDEWIKRLGRSGIEYFSVKDCRSLRGPFRKLVTKHGSAARKVADKVRSDLEDVLLSVDWWGGFGLGVVVPDYDAAFHLTPSVGLFFDGNDPTVPAYGQMMYQIARRVRRQTPAQEIAVAYFVDQSNYALRIQNAHAAIRINHPMIAKSLVAPPIPMDDKVTPALQAADLIASIVKDAFVEWIGKGRPDGGVVLGEKWNRHFAEPIGIWDKGHMLRTVRKSVKSKQFFARKIARQPAKPVSARDRKRGQRVLVLKRKFERGVKVGFSITRRRKTKT